MKRLWFIARGAFGEFERAISAASQRVKPADWKWLGHDIYD
jgi:hypothetical protein